MKKTLYSLLFLCSYVSLQAQNKMEQVCNAILQNNPSISAYQNYTESIRLSAKTGILPQNPTVEFNYLWGNPSDMGNQTEFAIIQAFDFPTMYVQQGNLSALHVQQADLQLKLYEKAVMASIQAAYIEQIYLNRREQELQRRMDNANRFFTSFQEKFVNGEINQIELTKSQMQFLTTKNDFLTVQNKLAVNSKSLEWLNGNIAIQLPDTIYPELALYTAPDTLLAQLKNNNLDLQIAQLETEIADRQVAIQKSNALPKFEIGYVYEGVANQSLRGVHTGISIPLWENKNTVKVRKTEYLFQQQAYENLQNQKQVELQQKIQTLQQLEVMITDSKLLIDNSMSLILLTQQLESGLISVTAYYAELSDYYSFMDGYEAMQKEYYMLIIELQRAIN